MAPLGRRGSYSSKMSACGSALALTAARARSAIACRPPPSPPSTRFIVMPGWAASNFGLTKFDQKSRTLVSELVYQSMRFGFRRGETRQKHDAGGGANALQEGATIHLSLPVRHGPPPGLISPRRSKSRRASCLAPRGRRKGTGTFPRIDLPARASAILRRRRHAARAGANERESDDEVSDDVPSIISITSGPRHASSRSVSPDP